jgi:L,D-transpeptidase YbiS
VGIGMPGFQAWALPHQIARMTVVDFLHVSAARQEVVGFNGSKELVRYQVSTAAAGLGCERGSAKTPIGTHRIRAKIGAGCPIGAVFVGRRWTGEQIDPDLLEQYPARDWMLSRALWLQGMDPSVNRGGNVDSLRRHVYFHGTHDEDLIGQAVSYGCVRMRNREIIELFDLVDVGCRVLIG